MTTSIFHFAKRKYFPTGDLGANPIHEVRDWCYARRLARACLRGEAITPILIDGTRYNCNLLTGTHRAAANDILNRLGHDARIDHISLQDLDEEEHAELYEAAAEQDFERIDKIWDRA